MDENCGHEYRERLGSAAAGRELLAHLAHTYRHSSPEEWRSRIEAGLVLLDGERVPARTELQAGQLLTWRRPPWREPEAPLVYAIVHRDPHLLAVAKPAGLPTLPGAGFLENTLLALVRRTVPEAAPLHRLGRWTSGLVLFGRTREVRAAVAGDWRRRSVHKLYRTLASGDPAADELTVEHPIGPVPHDRLGTVHGATPGGRPARTRVLVRERREGAFLADVEIETGRPHQIRIHLAAAGHPLVGDPLYATGGRPSPGCTALPGDPGYRLHAMRLRLRHPVTDEDLELRCEPPSELRLADATRPGATRPGATSA